LPFVEENFGLVIIAIIIISILPAVFEFIQSRRQKTMGADAVES
jgi:membrane-associated protein